MTDEYIDDSEQSAPDVIDDIYKSMSQIVESLNTDNLMLNKQVTKLQNELDFICSMVIVLKTENEQLTKKLEEFKDLKKYITDTRVILMQMLDLHTKNVQKEIQSIKNS